MQSAILTILVILTTPLVTFADAGFRVAVTKANQPEFIRVEATRLQDGSTRFVITLKPDNDSKPDWASVLIEDGERFRFTARLALDQEKGKDEWHIKAWADDDCVRNGRILITYGRTDGISASRNWSVAFAEFAPSR